MAVQGRSFLVTKRSRLTRFVGVLALLAALAFLAGCGSLAKDQTVCPEFRDLRCPAGASCSLDRERGCRVCQCNAINALTPTTLPDDRNVPPPVVVPQ